jgi:hypothetical protein
MSTGAYPGPRPDRAAAQRTRDAAFARISRVRRRVIIGAGAATAAVAGLVSAVAHGRTLSTKGTHGAPAASRPAPRSSGVATVAQMPPLASPSQLGLSGPGSAPQSDPQSQQTSPSSPAPSSSGSSQSAPSAPVQSSPSAATSGGS